MKSVNIKLSVDMNSVRRFVHAVEKYPFDIDLRSGRYVVDAKSIMGIFSIDLSRPVRMDIYSDDYAALLKEIESYIVEE